MSIERHWVETSDERCPLACVWFALPEIAADQDDEPELPRPAFSFFRLNTGCLQPIHTSSAPFTLAQSLKNSIQTLAALVLFTISLAANAQQQDMIEGRPVKLPDAPAPVDEAIADDVSPLGDFALTISPGRRTSSSRRMGRFTRLTRATTAFWAAGSTRLPCSARCFSERSCGAIRRRRRM